MSDMDKRVREIMANDLEAREVLQQLEHLQQENENLKKELYYSNVIKPNAAAIWALERGERIEQGPLLTPEQLKEIRKMATKGAGSDEI